MMMALREMVRIVKSDARLIFVLGRESSVQGVRFFNGELVTELAVRGVALEVERRQERVFRNRYGADIYEDILHFRSADELPDENFSLVTARHIAKQVLSATRSVVSYKERSGIDDAIERLWTVSSSPIPPIPQLSDRRP